MRKKSSNGSAPAPPLHRTPPPSVSSSAPSQPLLDHLLASVRNLPRSCLPTGHGHLTLSVLFSPPRMAKVLYPWAHLDAPRSIASGAKPFPQHNETVQTWEEMVFFHAEWRRHDEHEDDVKMIAAIEAYNYSLPEYGSQVFYLSKLDTTGWAPRLQNARVQRHLLQLDGGDASSSSSSSTSQRPPTSLTTHLTVSFLSYFLSLRHKPLLPTPSRPLRHASCHILARAQEAYIFPNSPENPRKKPLSDAKLVVWWRETLSQVIEAIRAQKQQSGEEPTPRIDAYYMMPGLERLESHPLVPLPPVANGSNDALPLVKAQWRYGHPYSVAGSGRPLDDLPPLPLHLPQPKYEAAYLLSRPRRQHERGIATLLPRFEDDPQSRFLDELAGEGDEIGKWSHLLKQQGEAVAATNAIIDEESQVSTIRASSPPHGAYEDSQATIVASDESQVREQRTPKKPRLAAVERVMDLRSSTSARPETPVRSMSSSPSDSRAASPSSSPSGARRSPRNHSPSKAAAAVVNGTGRLRTPSASPTKKLRPPASQGPSSSPSTILPSSPLAASSSSPSKSTASSSTHPRLTQAQTGALRSRLALDSCSPDEFWERMAFRQECSSGNLVGAFFVGVTAPVPPPGPRISPRKRGRADDAAAGDDDLLPAAETRPTHTIPLRELQKAMRNGLQLDDCYWQRDREAIELTQSFDEERGRLLCHLGRLPNEGEERKFEGEEAWRVGKGVVWGGVEWKGYGVDEVGRAEEAAKKELEAKKDEGGAGGGGGEKKVTMLSVKRKKPPPAS